MTQRTEPLLGQGLAESPQKSCELSGKILMQHLDLSMLGVAPPHCQLARTCQHYSSWIFWKQQMWTQPYRECFRLFQTSCLSSWYIAFMKGSRPSSQAKHPQEEPSRWKQILTWRLGVRQYWTLGALSDHH